MIERLARWKEIPRLIQAGNTFVKESTDLAIVDTKAHGSILLHMEHPIAAV
jgi:hypothetical protein